MSIKVDTHTVHTIVIDIPDDILGQVDLGLDDVQVQLRGRLGMLSSPKRLTYRDLVLLIEGGKA